MIDRSVKHASQPPPALDVPRELVLGIDGFSYPDLHDPVRLGELLTIFESELRERDAPAWERLVAWRNDPDALGPLDVSNTILAVAPHVEHFVARLFRVEDAIEKRARDIRAEDPTFAFKHEFVKKRVLKPGAGASFGGTADEAARVARAALAAVGADLSAADEEREVAVATLLIHEGDDTARKVQKHGGATWTDELRARAATVRAALGAERAGEPEKKAAGDEGDFEVFVRAADAIEAWLAARHANPEDACRAWASLHVPHKQHYDALVQLRRTRADLPEELVGPEESRRERTEPFALTDRRGTKRQIAAHVDYCIYCHDRDKDSCSKGLRDKAGAIKKNPIGVALNGCPLREKISEMHTLRHAGGVISALATVMIDNPMLPGTGHRICNDCMKACIYQAQEPVDIPQIETRVLTDVLTLPWGFEVWSFLTRWNPLHPWRPVTRPYVGKNVLVVGLGPAGYTLAQHLLNEGFGVVGVDGLKIEPLPAELVGDASTAPRPLYDIYELREPLHARTLLGFGGVSEYGITVRWEKNFLQLLYLNLLRRRSFRAHGGVRFGGTFDVADAWALGFDHIAIAAGAGKPTYIRMKNNLIRGVRKASDFLMALQLTGAYKRDSLANLQVRLPAVVIGGGLTAIDTATELSAYYVVQAERTLARWETLVHEGDAEALRAQMDEEERSVLDEILAHGRALRAERVDAAQEGRTPRLSRLLDSWGGVSIVYRRSLSESPAYRLNHEEVAKSLEEGVRYVEHMAPLEAHPDRYGAVEAVTFERQAHVDGKLVGTGEKVRLPARTLCIAAGTSPNTSYEGEHDGTFTLEPTGYFSNHRAHVDDAGCVTLERTTDGSGFFTSYRDDANHTISYYGDNHPHYAGSVVKAMASAKDGYRHVSALFPNLDSLSPSDQVLRAESFRRFASHLDDELRATVHEVRRLTPTIVEVVVRAPMAARKFRPGQFYRLQNFERHAPRAHESPFLMEGLALTGAWTDPERGLLSTIVLEMGGSSRICAMLKPGEPVVLMGPTGQPTEIVGETVLLAGGGLGNAVLFSIARAFKAHGSKVIYFAGYRTADSVFKREEIEESTDQVIWSADRGTIEPRRPQDATFRGNIVEAILAYEAGALGEKRIDLGEVDRIIAIGSDKMMAAVKDARHGALAPYLKRRPQAIGSINSPMQCMMKAICAQCLQRLVDPVTGKEEMVYTCFNQDLELDRVDFPYLAARLRQNSVQEKISNMWLDRMLEQTAARRV